MDSLKVACSLWCVVIQQNLQVNQVKSHCFKSASAGQGDGVTILPVVHLSQAGGAKERFMLDLSGCHLTIL